MSEQPVREFPGQLPNPALSCVLGSYGYLNAAV